jgi:serine/threonine-protein kinase
MDFMRRGSLADQCAKRPAVRTVVRWLAALTRAVHHAHRQGVVHGDLKPSNVLLDDHGRPVLSDFGLARAPSLEQREPGCRLFAGSPAYMAPELFSEAAKPPSPSADIWALGVMLYELLTGQRPFGGTGLPELVQAVRFQEPVPLNALLPRIPAPLADACARCLAKRPADRYPSAAELVDDLRKSRNSLSDCSVPTAGAKGKS